MKPETPNLDLFLEEIAELKRDEIREIEAARELNLPDEEFVRLLQLRKLADELGIEMLDGGE